MSGVRRVDSNLMGTTCLWARFEERRLDRAHRETLEHAERRPSGLAVRAHLLNAWAMGVGTQRCVDDERVLGRESRDETDVGLVHEALAKCAREFARRLGRTSEDGDARRFQIESMNEPYLVALTLHAKELAHGFVESAVGVCPRPLSWHPGRFIDRDEFGVEMKDTLGCERLSPTRGPSTLDERGEHLIARSKAGVRAFGAASVHADAAALECCSERVRRQAAPSGQKRFERQLRLAGRDDEAYPFHGG